jgi:hypothetical protein
MTMTKAKTIRSHPIEHGTEALCTVAIAAAGQLLLSWLLAKAAASAERRDLSPA